MDNYGVIVGIILLAILAFTVVMQLRKSSGKKAVSEFLNSLSNKILETILNLIKESDPGKYTCLADFETATLNAIYDNVWELVGDYAQSSDAISVPIKTIFKYIDGDTLVDFINDMISANGIDEVIFNKYTSYSIEENEEAVLNEDKALAEEYSDDNKYIENSTDEDLAPAEDKEPTAEEVAALNPPSDEEEAFDVEDDSMEIVVDKKEIIHTVSRTGQDLYYEVNSNGKKTRVSKDYALAHMK